MHPQLGPNELALQLMLLEYLFAKFLYGAHNTNIEYELGSKNSLIS